MTSIQERLQIKREPLDKWSTKEQLCLASAVARSGDQNWMSVSRALKPFGDPNRPSDWFHQKNCAAQYGALLENVETPKRKKRTTGQETVIETPAESILRKLKTERLIELRKLMSEEKAEYVKLQEHMILIQSGNITEEQLDQWCKEIDEEEQQKEQEAVAHSKWLKERELRKQEIERVWRPAIKVNISNIGQKRKASDSIDALLDLDQVDETTIPTPEPGKSALSPLLTSLLKSPSHAQCATSSILHSAITSQRPVTTNPTIASLLNSTANVSVSPSLQQLVTSAIGQESVNSNDTSLPELPDDASDLLPNLKVEDIESTILSSEDPLPEIKEEVEVIISDLIENAEIVANPEEHLHIDGNMDLVDNLESELQELVKEENAAKCISALDEMKQAQQDKETAPDIDPFEFQEDPEIYTPVKQNSDTRGKQEVATNADVTADEKSIIKLEEIVESFEQVEEAKKDRLEMQGGSVEIVEVVVMEDDEVDKELNKSQIEDIVHSSKGELVPSALQENTASRQEEGALKECSVERLEKQLSCDDSNTESVVELELKLEPESNEAVSAANVDVSEPRTNTFTPDFNEELYDDTLSMEVKVDKSGKVKRDYSRTKRKEDKDMDLLFGVDQTHLEEELADTFSEKEFQDIEKKSEGKSKVKSENERSNSSWTEEEEISNLSKSRRRYSTPGTPVDSVPNSPGSSIAYDDDRDYRNWKRSVMLVYSRLTTHKFSSLFFKPITNEQAPGYHSVVYRPMDLQTIRKNIDNGNIRTTGEFQRDVLLMFNNAIMYNKTNKHIYNMARQMQQESIQQIQILLQAAASDTPVRRETRTSEPGSKRKRGPEEIVKNKKRKED